MTARPLDASATENQTCAEADTPKKFISISLPKQVGGKESAHFFTKDRKERAAVTLPPHFKVRDLDGVEQDVGYATFFCSKSQLVSFKNDAVYYHVGQPETNKDGEPWVVNLKKTTGHWENPEAESAADRGKWVVEDISYIHCTAREMQRAADACREKRREYAQARAQEREGESPRHPPRLGQAQREATTASENLSSERKACSPSQTR